MERVFKSNMFVYGEVGERLSGIRESEIYQQSAQKIENLIINEMGNLKIAKKLEVTNFQHNLIQLIDTKYNFYVGVTKDNNVATYGKKNNDIGNLLYTHPITVKNIRIIKMCDERLFVIGDITEVFEFNIENGEIGKSNYLDLIKLPIKERKNVSFDVYRVYKVGSDYRVALIGTFTNPTLSYNENDRTVTIGNSVKVEVFYKIYKASVSKENIDPIRYLSNNSSGKMGYSLAQAAVDLGAEVTLISGPTNLRIPKRLRNFISVESALEMYEKVDEYFEDIDIFIACAAIADYRPKEYKKEKIKKSDSDLILELVRNPDILFEMGKKKDKQLLVGFAAETNDIKENALKKLEKKNLDFIVANNASTMGNNTNTVEIIRKNKTSIKINQKNKIELAYDILKEIILDLKKVENEEK